jgi:hypothetical protein
MGCVIALALTWCALFCSKGDSSAEDKKSVASRSRDEASVRLQTTFTRLWSHLLSTLTEIACLLRAHQRSNCARCPLVRTQPPP